MKQWLQTKNGARQIYRFKKSSDRYFPFRSARVYVYIILSLLVGFYLTPAALAQVEPTLQDSLSGDANENGIVNPGDTVQYKAVISNTSNDDLENVNYQDLLDSNTTLISGSIKTTPLAIKDSFSTDCNTLAVDSPGVLGNDFDDNIPGLEVIWNSSPTALGKMVSVDAKGQFTYTPDEDVNATDSFCYAIRDADGNIDTGMACIAINSVNKLVFVDNSGSNGNGTHASPYNNLADAQSNSDPGDTIFVYEGSGLYTGGLTLQDSQVLLGASEGLNSECITIPPANRPRITNAFGHAITLAQANEIHGIIIDQPAQRGISGLNFDTLTVSNTTIRETGYETVYLDNGGVHLTIDSLSAINGPPNGLYLNGLAGSATFRNVTISNALQRGISITSCDGIIDFQDTTTLTNNAGNEIYMNNNTATVDFEDLRISCIVGAAIDGHNSTGKVTVQSGQVTHSGAQILNFNNMDGGSDFSGVRFDGSSSQGMQIQNSSGGHLFGPVTITNANVGIYLSGNSGAISFGGTTTLTSQITSGVNLSSNTGAIVSFNDLQIDHSTSNGAGVVASGGGTLNIATGSINSGTAVALDIDGMNTSTCFFSSLTSNGTSATGIDLTNNTGTWNLDTLNIVRTSGTALHAISAGTLISSGGALNSSNGEVMEIDNAMLNMTFSSVSSVSSSTSGIQLDNISGSLTINGGSITGASGTGFDVGGLGNGSGGSAVVTYSGSITNSSGRSVFIQELAGGSYTLSGNINDTGDGIKVSEINNGTAAAVTFSGPSKVVNTGTSNAVELADNTNGTVNFTNGGLDIDATSGTGFSSTNGGTVNVSGAGNTVATTTGTGVDIDNAALDIALMSISSNGGSNPGIDLNTTTGSFTVTGTGTTQGSGGTVENKLSDGLVFNSVSNITLKNMIIEDIGNMTVSQSEHDGIHIANITDIVLDNLIIRRMSDMALHGADFPNGTSATNISNLEIHNCLFEDSNRFHESGNGDSSDEGLVRIVGVTDTVNITNSTFQRGAELIDFFTGTSGTLEMTVTSNSFNYAYKEFSSGGISSVGRIGLDVTVQGGANANVTVGDESNSGLGNSFLNCRIASVRLGNDAGATGNMTLIVSNNDFTVDDHSSGINGDFDFPMGGLKLISRGTNTAVIDAIVSNNYFDEVTNADGGVGQFTLDMDGGQWQVSVENNTFDTPGNAPFFVKADNSGNAGNMNSSVLFQNNSYIRGPFCSPDPSAQGGGCDLGTGDLCAGTGGYCGPGLRSLVQTQSGGNIDITFSNEDFTQHDVGFDPGNTVEIQAMSGGGTACVNFENNSSPHGYAVEHSGGTLNVEKGASDTGPCSGCTQTQIQDVLDDNGNTGGGGSSGTSPPDVTVFGTVNVISGQCTQPSGGIFAFRTPYLEGPNEMKGRPVILTTVEENKEQNLLFEELFYWPEY